MASCRVGHRHGSDPALLRLWCRLAAAAPIQPLVWELPYVAGAAVKKKKRKERKRRKEKKKKKREEKKTSWDSYAWW